MDTKFGNAFDAALDWIGKRLASKLNKKCSGYYPYTPSDFDTLCGTLLPGDVLLIEGNERVSTAVKYLTKSTWSHAAIFVGDAIPVPENALERPRLIEVNLGQGCVAVPLSKYETYNTRICRPVGLNPDEHAAAVAFMVDRLGLVTTCATYSISYGTFPLHLQCRFVGGDACLPWGPVILHGQYAPL